jgi:hypothetical protein
VQEVWLRWQATDRAVVANPPAFLATTTTRLAVNVAQFARSRREAYGGSWLPEPGVSTAPLAQSPMSLTSRRLTASRTRLPGVVSCWNHASP